MSGHFRNLAWPWVLSLLNPKCRVSGVSTSIDGTCVLIYPGFDPFLSMVYYYFTIYISMFSTLLGMFSGSGAFRSKAMTLEHFGA